MKNFNFNIILAIIVVVMLVGAAAYFVNKSEPSSKITGIKTYADNDFGFSFKYPSKYIVSREGQREYADMVLTITSDSKKLGIMDSCSGEYTIQVKKSDVSFDQLEQEVKSKYNYISDLSIESKIVDGHKALRISGINKVGTDFTGKHSKDYPEDFILFDNGNTYIGFYPCLSEYYNQDEISQIYSSFGFIK